MSLDSFREKVHFLWILRKIYIIFKVRFKKPVYFRQNVTLSYLLFYFFDTGVDKYWFEHSFLPPGNVLIVLHFQNAIQRLFRLAYSEKDNEHHKQNGK